MRPRSLTVVFTYFYLIEILAARGHQPGQLDGLCEIGSSKRQCLTSNSLCVRGVCQCAPLYYATQNECRLRNKNVTFNRKCVASSECADPGEYCSEQRKCTCLSTFVRLKDECKPVISPGEYGCEDSLQCSEQNPDAFCDHQQICQCPNGTQAIARKCILAEGFFAKLTNFFRRKPTSSPSDEITTTYRHYSSPDEDIFDAHAERVSQASCQNGEVYVDEAGTCMAVQYPGQPCQYSKQCDAVEDGSFCSRLRCECASGMQISGRSCVYSNQNCQEKGLIWIEEVGECKRAIPPGSTGCSHSSQCASVFKGSSCYRQTCNCPSPLFPVNGTCGPLCPPQQTFSSVTGECLPKISPGGECLYSRQCNAAQLGTACIRGRCRCVDKFVFNGMNCAKSCHKGFVSNKYGICRRECSRNQVEYDSDCYDKVSVGQRCEFHAQCSANSTCLQGVCTCPVNTVLKSGSCRPKEVQPMESCADGEQCIGGSYCHNEKCVCPSGTKIIGAQCVTQIAVGPGENCLRQNVKCSEGSVCMSGVCSCLTGTILHKGKCERHVSVDPGGSCGRGEHCEGGSFCDHNIWKCVCPLDKIEIGKKCYPRLKSAPGFPCGNKEICIGGSYCLDDICVCAPSQVRQGRQCVTRRRVPAGSRCNSADICMGSSNCLDGFCECDEGKSVKQGECVITKQASPGDGCGQGERCGGGSNCVNKICTCPANYIVYEQQCRLQPISQPGMRCGRGERCVGDSYCDYDRSTCVCRNDFVANAGKCQPPTEVGVQPLSMLLRGSTHSSSSFTTPTFAPHASITRTPSNTQHPIEAAETPTDSPFTIIGHHIISQVSHPAASTQRKTSHQMRSAGHISAENQRRVVNTERLSKQGSQIQSRSDQVIPNGRNSTSDVSNDAYLKSDQANVVDEIVKPADEVTVVNQIQTVKSRQSPTPVGANLRSDVEEGSRSMASAQSVYHVTRCRDDRECSGGTRCARGYCLCPVYHTLIDGKCHSANSATTISAATLARPRRCVASIQCSNGTECIWGVCRCPRGTTQSQLGVCSPERTERQKREIKTENRIYQNHLTIIALGEACDMEMPNRCDENAACIDGTCHCDQSSAQKDDSCIPKQLGDQLKNCTSNQGICSGGMYCLKGVCVCPTGQHLIHGSCASTEPQFNVHLHHSTKPLKNPFIPFPTHSPTPLINLIQPIGYPDSSSFANSQLFHKSPLNRFHRDANQAQHSNFLSYPFITGASAFPFRQFDHPNNNPIVNHDQGNYFYPTFNNIPMDNNYPILVTFNNALFAMPGESCQVGVIQCSGGSLCLLGVCTCPHNQMSLNGLCTTLLRGVSRSQRYPNQPCSSDSVCVGRSACINGFCRCPLGMFAAEGSAVCINDENNAILPQLSGYPGQRCGTITDLKGCNGGAICINSLCICPDDQVIYENRCVAYLGQAPAGGSCVLAGTVCEGGSACQNGICECGLGSVAQNGRCVPANSYQPTPILEPGAVCVSLCAVCAQCGGGSICVNGICKCPIGYFPFRSRCVPFQTQPPPTSSTPVSIVAHPPMAHPEVKSFVLARPGDKCNASEICDGGSSCIIGRCVCPPGYVPDDGRTSCINILLEPLPHERASHPGQSCLQTNKCDGGAKCVDGICLCPVNSYQSYNKCIKDDPFKPILYPGSRCNITDKCQLNSKCLNGSCVCPEQFDTSASGFCTNATSKIIKKGLAGSHCSANSSCASSTLLCSSSEHCICSDGFIGDGHGDCSKIAKPFARSSSLPQFTEVLPGESCMNGEKCIGGSMCVFGKCACRSGIARRGLMCHSEIHPFKRSLSDRHSNRIHRFNGVRSHQRHTMITACPSDGSCQLPDCYCSRTGMEIPGGYNASEIPQMVVLTFEGAVTDRIIQMYKSLFTGRFRNPNGCPIHATFFITHEWNNYDQSQWLMSTGHEIGVSSMTGDVLNQTSKQRWHAEMNGMREALGLFSYVPVNEIIGLRAPRHQLGGDNQFSTMLSSDFKYDSTTSFSGGPYWPQTLDYKLAWECSENGCPQKPYPGLWELPISPLKRLDSGDESTTVKDIVKSGDSPNDIATMLEKNFRRHYYNNRAPFVIAIDSDYLTSLQDNGALKALEIFIEQILQNQDVYVVSASQALQWLQLPTRLQKIPNFKAWQCSNQSINRVQPCEYPSICTLRCDRDELHSFRVCGSCPLAYPKIGDPRGSGNVIMVN